MQSCLNYIHMPINHAFFFIQGQSFDGGYLGREAYSCFETRPIQIWETLGLYFDELTWNKIICLKDVLPYFLADYPHGV